MAVDLDPLTIKAELWLQLSGRNFAGAKRVLLLSEIRRVGSLTHAAKAAGLSYKGAWDAIEDMSKLAGAPLLERTAGGKGGGHTRLTPRGERMVHNFAVIQQEHARFVNELNRRLDEMAADKP